MHSGLRGRVRETGEEGPQDFFLHPASQGTADFEATANPPQGRLPSSGSHVKNLLNMSGLRRSKAGDCKGRKIGLAGRRYFECFSDIVVPPLNINSSPRRTIVKDLAQGSDLAWAFLRVHCLPFFNYSVVDFSSD